MTEEFTPQDAQDEVRPDDGPTAGARTGATSSRGARAVPRYADGPTDAGPAVTRHEIGEGVAWYLGTHLDAESLGRILERVADDVDVRPATGIRPAPPPDVGGASGPAHLPGAPAGDTTGAATGTATGTATGDTADLPGTAVAGPPVAPGRTAPGRTAPGTPPTGATPPPPGWVAPGAAVPVPETPGTPGTPGTPAPATVEGERTWVSGRRPAGVPETTAGHGVRPAVRPAPAWARGGSGPVEVLRRRGPQGWYLFVLNHSGIPVEVPVSGDDLITGSRARGVLRVPAGGCAVVRELPSDDG